MHHTFYVQNEDHPELNDESTVEYLDGVLTLDCNGHTTSFKVNGPAPSETDLQRVEAEFGDYPVNPDDPKDVTDVLGLELGEATELPENSGLQPPKL